MANRILDISPEKLCFLGDYSQETSTRLKLNNLSQKSVYFKLRCNEDARKSKVTPNRGILRPNEHCEVRIVLEPFKCNPVGKNIKFLIEYIQKEDDSVIDTVENVFNSFLGPRPSHFLECSFSNSNPFAEYNRTQSPNDDTSVKEIEKLRMENAELRNQVEALKGALAIQSKKDSANSTKFDESFEHVDIDSPTSINAIEDTIITSFQNLMDKILQKKKSILLQLEKVQGKHTSEIEIHKNKLAQYQEQLFTHSRSLSIAKDNYQLEVHHDVRDFYNNRVLELSQKIIPEPKLYFRIFLPPILTALDEHVQLKIED